MMAELMAVIVTFQQGEFANADPEQVQKIIDLLHMIRGVVDVSPVMTEDAVAHAARQQVRYEYFNKIVSQFEE